MGMCPSTPDPRVRPAHPADRTRLLAVQAAALAEPAPTLLAAALDGVAGRAFVAGHPPVGYALVVPGGEAAYLAELAVAPPHQGEGHGSALLSHVASTLAADHDRLRVVVWADDERARAFYERRGFRVTGRLPDRFERGEGVSLVRDLE